MKNILSIILALFCFSSFSQHVHHSNNKMNENSIDWISLKEAEYLSRKYDRTMLIFFYRPGCEYCDKMKKTVLSDPQISKKINENFYPVMLNGKSKKEITYNNKKYINDASIEEDPKSTWRHNLFAELVDPVKGNYYWPNIVVINGDHQKIKQFPGFQSKQQLLRNLNKLLK